MEERRTGEEKESKNGGEEERRSELQHSTHTLVCIVVQHIHAMCACNDTDRRVSDNQQEKDFERQGKWNLEANRAARKKTRKRRKGKEGWQEKRGGEARGGGGMEEEEEEEEEKEEVSSSLPMLIVQVDMERAFN